MIRKIEVERFTLSSSKLSIGIAAPKGKLSPAAEKFWQCAKEAASDK